ncbi:glycosyltransferase family 4 protein, partial [bacterium]|nr:glycosyltransferase family 4 protein [bacterium]
VYAAADVFCLSSLAEGLSNAIIEALSLELPCLVSEAGGNGELVAHGERGWTFPAGDISACTEGLRRLLTEREESIRMGQAGRQWVERELSWKTNLEQHRQLCEEAIQRHTTRRRQR